MYYVIFLFFLFHCQTWRKHEEGDPWPRRRCYHIAACLGYGRQHQRLLISGGAGGVLTNDDMWLMDSQSVRMEEVRIAPDTPNIILNNYCAYLYK